MDEPLPPGNEVDAMWFWHLLMKEPWRFKHYDFAGNPLPGIPQGDDPPYLTLEGE